jgi:hypothetical protein
LAALVPGQLFLAIRPLHGQLQSIGSLRGLAAGINAE